MSVTDIARSVGCSRASVARLATSTIHGSNHCDRHRHALAEEVRKVVARIEHTRRKKGERKAATASMVLDKLPKEWKAQCSVRGVQRAMKEFGLYSDKLGFYFIAFVQPD
jgi:hypothetical protein